MKITHEDKDHCSKYTKANKPSNYVDDYGWMDRWMDRAKAKEGWIRWDLRDVQ